MFSPQLNYAQKSALPHRSLMLRYAGGLVVFALLASCILWLPSAVRRAELLYWQGRCMAYLAAADELVYDRAHSIQRVPKPWQNFYSIFSPPGFQAEATVFMHELKKQNGDSRLVIVDFVPTPGGEIMQFSRVFVPGSPGELPEEISKHQGVPVIAFPQSQTLLYAGHVDPANPNHFTFRAQVGNRQALYDGWLQNDDTVTIGEEKLWHL